MGVIAVSQQALWRPVPSSRDVLSVRLLGVYPPTAAKVCQLEAFVDDQYVLWLDVPASKQNKIGMTK